MLFCIGELSEDSIRFQIIVFRANLLDRKRHKIHKNSLRIKTGQMLR
jgi:hypothetical protein